MKLVTVIGARPQFVKAAAVARAIRTHNAANPSNPIEERIVHTGQHYDANMSDVFFEELDIPNPAYNLGIGSGSHGQQTGHMLMRLEEILQAERPDALLVYGDTNSTLAGALAASKLHIPIAHVEAGLRSFNRRMPEEINRVLTDHMSDILFCPTKKAVTNLSEEGIHRNVYDVGDVMYDCFLIFSRLSDDKSLILNNLSLTNTPYYLATIHRAENTDHPERLKNIFEALGALDLPVVMPLHPRTRNALKTKGIVPDAHIRMLEPLPYLDMCQVLKNARLVLTDSGGLQKEAMFAGVPCITLRDETEWGETVTSGCNQLVGAEKEAILAAVHSRGATLPPQGKNPYGDGHASEHIVTILSRL